MEKKYIDIGKETYAYLDEGQGEPVLLIHGNMSSSIHYIPLIERISSKFRCIAPDLRGFGDSTYNNRFDSFKELAEDVALFLDKLGLDSVYAAGWSAGGGTGLELCALYPEKVKKFFCIEATSCKGYPIFKKDENMQNTGIRYDNKEDMAQDPVSVLPMLKVFGEHDVPTISQVWDLSIYNVNKPTKEQNDLWIEETLKERCLADLDWCLASLNMTEEEGPYGKGDGNIRKVKCPVAITRGEQDLVVPPYMADVNAQELGELATLLPYENCGHSPFVDCPDRLAEDMIAFFS